MQFYYGEKNLLRMLDETQFWKRQETEHTVVIREVAPNLEQVFVDTLMEWERAFAQTEGVAIKYIETIIRSNYKISPVLQRQAIQFIHFSLNQSQQFILLLNKMTSESEAIRNNRVVIVVINHIRRESEYFIGIVQTFLDSYNAIK